MFDKNKFEAELADILKESVRDTELREILGYSLLAGGKRLRPELLITAYDEFTETPRRCGASERTALYFAAALECIHTYSLIHDDLPCMDDSALRRGRPTSHMRFGEAEAVLAGDALLNLAYELMSRAALGEGAADARACALRAMSIIGSEAGACGMVLGQYIDTCVDSGSRSESEMLRMYALKTGGLIMAALAAGAALAGAGEEALKRAESIGRDIGLIFQITDDLMDINSTEGEMGKSKGGDFRIGKQTYPALFGEKRTEELLGELVKKVKEEAVELGIPSLAELAANFIGRRK